MFNKHLPLLHGNVSILPEVRFFPAADTGNAAVQRRIFRNKRVCLPKNSCLWVASSPSQSSLRDARFPLLSLRDIFPRPGEVGPQSGSPWQSTQSSSLCQGLSQRERCRGVSRNGEGEDAKVKTFTIMTTPIKKLPKSPQTFRKPK